MFVGLAAVFGLALYLLLSAFAVWLSVRYARAHQKSARKYGVATALALYLVVFWDWIPIEATYKYRCWRNGGFTEFKSLDQWRAEHPGVAETLRPDLGTGSETDGNRTRFRLNQRFAWDIYRIVHAMEIGERREEIVDTVTGEVLARYVDFRTTQNADNPSRFFDYKIWVGGGSCERTERMTDEKQFYLIKYQFQFQKEYVNGVK